MDDHAGVSALPMDTRVAQALAVPTRARLLGLLRAAAAALTAAELAAEVGLHVNTARVHLEVLVDVGLATRVVDTPRGPGRPHMMFAAATGAPVDPAADGDRELAGLLVDGLAAMPDGERLAIETGRRWASVIDGMGWPDRPHTPDEAQALLVDLLDRLGFAPTTEPLGDRIYLHACPFTTLARRAPSVVCGVHLGLLRAAIDRLGVRLAVSSVDPFVRTDLCVVQLGPD